MELYLQVFTDKLRVSPVVERYVTLFDFRKLPRGQFC